MVRETRKRVKRGGGGDTRAVSFRVIFQPGESIRSVKGSVRWGVIQ